MEGNNSPKVLDNASTLPTRFQVALVKTQGLEDVTGDEKKDDRSTIQQDRPGEVDDDGLKKVIVEDGQNDTSVTFESNDEDSNNMLSLRHYTHEALPRLDHYRNIHSLHAHSPRPTLEELHDDNLTPAEKLYSRRLSKVFTGKKGAVKFGWIQGVLVRCLLNIWGVMLFLRLSWVVGQAGIGLACLIVLLATVVTILTTMSMSAICTNGEVKGGGTYYMISRCLGPEFGGSIGFIFAVANAVAVAMYVVGFAETLKVLLWKNDIYIVDNGINDIRIISCSTVFVILAIAIVGTQWETKAQIILLIILLAAMADFLAGTILQPTEEQIAKGFVGWNVTIIMSNLGPNYRGGESFFSVFSVFFPAATGILAGANISGDLKDPQKAIPKGTLLAIFITTVSYMLFAVIAGSMVLLDSNGIIELVQNGTPELLSNCSLSADGKCKYGLMNDYQVMEMVSAFSPIIYGGIFAATLSSALASLVSAPKIFQALCKDELFPGIRFFEKGYGRNNEPRRGYLLAFFVALGCCAIGDLNHIAPLISNFFLAAYCLINLSCFHASFVKSPGFRPAFRYYSMWLSFLGALLCLVVMFIINWVTAFVTFAVVLILYLCIYHRKPDVNWGSSTQAQTYSMALNAVTKLNEVADHVKNYRPQLLVLSGNPSHRPPLIDFGYTITKRLSLMICGNVVTKEHLTHRLRSLITDHGQKYLSRRHTKAFYNTIEDKSFSRGVSALVQICGMGKLRPNMILMGYKNNWESCDYTEVQEYFNVIHDSLDMHMSIGILRLPDGLDYSEYATELEKLTSLSKKEKHRIVKFTDSRKEFSNDSILFRNKSASELSTVSCTMDSSRESTPPSTPCTLRSQANGTISENPQGHLNLAYSNSTNTLNGDFQFNFHKSMPDDVYLAVNRFQRKQKKGNIDVWWLYDDGGLTMLIPHILTTKSLWSGCKLRIFALANKQEELDREQRNMAALLNKFRIDYSDVTVVPGIVNPPAEASKKEFEALINKWLADGPDDKPVISEAELCALKDKTNRHIRLRELLLTHSKKSVQVVMTLPMPRKSTCSAALYMAWLETLTRDMPPFLFIRGNQTSVLTFYS